MRSRSRPAVAAVICAVAAWPFSILAFAVVVTQFTMLSIPAILMSAGLATAASGFLAALVGVAVAGRRDPSADVDLTKVALAAWAGAAAYLLAGAVLVFAWSSATRGGHSRGRPRGSGPGCGGRAPHIEASGHEGHLSAPSGEALGSPRVWLGTVVRWVGIGHRTPGVREPDLRAIPPWSWMRAVAGSARWAWLRAGSERPVRAS